MADLYVKTGGDDTENGTTEALAWATIDKAATEATAGDTVHIAPGTYRETVVADNAGAVDNKILFVGDPECEWFDNENPGRVRVTGADGSEVAQAVTVITSQQDYVEWHDLHIDGGDYGIQFGSDRDSKRAIRDSSVVAATYGVSSGSAYRCSVLAGDRAYSSCLVYQSVGTANYGYRYCQAFNSLAVGGRIGFLSLRGHTYNCIAIGANIGGFAYAYAANGEYYYYNCVAIGCNAAGNLIDPGYAIDCYYTMCDSVGDADFGSEGKVANLNLAALRDLMPWFGVNGTGGLLRQGDNAGPSFSSDDTDISGHRKRLKGSDLDIGPWSISEPTDQPGGMLDWDIYQTSAPSIHVQKEGDVSFKVPCEAGAEVTITVQAKHVSITGDKPQLVLRGDSISEQTGTHTAADDTWQELSVAATPTHDEVLTCILRARNSAGDCYFSDRSVSYQ